MRKLMWLINLWAHRIRIFSEGTIEGQLEKLYEEVDELKDAITANDLEKIMDSIGDATVVLIIIATWHGLDYIKCVRFAWSHKRSRGGIKNRTGKMVQGVFVKDA